MSEELKDHTVIGESFYFHDLVEPYATWLHIVKAACERNIQRPSIVCLCGSTRFTDIMQVKQWEFTKAGHIVLTWCALPEWYFNGPHIGDREGVKEAIDELHKRKIDLCDFVFVIDVEGYIGQSTRSEIDYAEAHGKPVKYLSKEEPDYVDNLAARHAAAKPTGWRVLIVHKAHYAISESWWVVMIITPDQLHEAQIAGPFASEEEAKDHPIVKGVIDALHAKVEVVPMEKKGDASDGGAT